MKKYYAVIDIETDGTSISAGHQILEVACVMLDDSLNRVGKFNQLVTPSGNLRMSDYVQDMHTKSGLLEDLKNIGNPPQYITQVDLMFSDFLKSYKTDDSIIMAVGNSIGSLDIPFIKHYMKKSFEFFHYRSIDVSGMREGMQLLLGANIPVNKVKGHRALQDIEECIDEFKMLGLYIRYPLLLRAKRAISSLTKKFFLIKKENK